MQVSNPVEMEIEKSVCINGRFFCRANIKEVQRVFANIAKKIIKHNNDD
jgi:hypothetical protein